jgi:dTDP-4-amino-4,6-dideoxygalactose transaminase
VNNKRVITVNSGTSAIHLAIRLAGIGPGDEVITTPMTCIATNVPIMAFGAKIVWADVDKYTGLIDPIDVESKITDRTKAIISVDWGGIPVDYDVLREIADTKGIYLISDAAHSLGATYELMKVGSTALSDFTCFSFQAIKTVTAVDGGALTVGNDKDYERGRRLRWFGVPRDTDVKFRGAIDVPEWGYKFHMNDINATVGIHTLKHLNVALGFMRDNAGQYSRELSPYFGQYLPEEYAVHPAWWLYTVLLPDSEERERFKTHMESNGVEVSQVHWRNDLHTTFRDFLPTSPLKGLDYYSDRMICIPNHSQLTRPEVSKVIEVMNEFVA